MNPNVLLNWWANENIVLPATVCPASPTGELQSANAFVLPANQGTLYATAFAVTAAIALAGVLATYRTRTMGDRFASRWRWAALITSLLAAAASLAVVMVPKVSTYGCQYGNTTTHIPLVDALERASVAVVQAPLFFFVFSFLLTRFARITRAQPWYNNSRYPV